MRNLSAFKIIGTIGTERRAKGGALFHISFACFTSTGLELFSGDYHYKRWTYILCSNGLKLLDTGLRLSVN